jgi:hypothetical protein
LKAQNDKFSNQKKEAEEAFELAKSTVESLKREIEAL